MKEPLNTFEEQIPKDKTGHKSPIDISPIRLSDVEEDMPAKVHEEMQTEPVDIVQSEVQTELATKMKLCQTEWEQKGIGCQMEWEQKGIRCQMAWEEKGIGCQMEIENAVKETQTKYGTQVQETQTETVSKVQETQTEKHMEDKQCETNWEQQGMACQTEIENAVKETQTEIEDNNILTVDRIEIVERVETQGTQTDLAELEAMQPFWEVDGPNPLDVDNKDDTEIESILSSASKSEDVPKIATGAGLDMRRGEYHEVEFPPVASTLVKHKPVESTPKQRTPSPIDLCTTTKGTVKKKKSEEENTTPKKVIPLCAISEDLRDVLRGVSKQKPSDLKLTPAHGINLGRSGSLSKVNIQQQMCVKDDIPATDLRKKDNESPKNEDGPGIKLTSPLAYSSLSGRQFINTRGSTLLAGYGGFGKRHTPPILRSSSHALAGFYANTPDRSRSSGARNLFSSMSPPATSASRNLFTSITSQPKKCASGDIEDSLGNFVSFFGGMKQWCIRDNPRSARPSQEHQMVRWNPSMITTMHGTVDVKGEVVEVKRRKILSTAASCPSHSMTDVDVQDKVEENLQQKFPATSHQPPMSFK